MPRILLISSNSSERGGGERYLVFLTKGLKELGFEVFVLLSNISYMDVWAKNLTEVGGIVNRLNLLSLKQRPIRFLQATNDFKQINLIATFCKDINPSAILVNQQYDEDGLDYLMAAMKVGCVFGGIMHMPMTAKKNQRRLGWIRGQYLAKWYHKHPYRLIFVSDGAQMEFESYYSHPRPTFVVNNSIPLDSLPEVSLERKIFSTKQPVIGFVGQFVAQKNLTVLIEAWLKSREKGIDSRLLLVGDGPERVNLERMLWHSAPPGSWFITGWTATPEAYFNEIDLFILTSHFEGLPLSLLEALGRGIPAIVTPFNGALDVAYKAPWLKIASENSIDEIAYLIIDTLKNIQLLKLTAKDGLKEFRNYFSLKRMALGVLNVLGLEVN